MKDEIQSYLFNNFLTDEGQFEINFRAPYFIAKDISISNLTYEINENTLCVDGNYILKAKFDFENIQLLNEEDRKDERYNDLLFSGSFGITIDKDEVYKKFASLKNEDIQAVLSSYGSLIHPDERKYYLREITGRQKAVKQYLDANKIAYSVSAEDYAQYNCACRV